jgi:hypothetical protein
MIHTHRLSSAAACAAALSLAGACLGQPARAADADTLAQARATYAEVNQNSPRMATQRFRARVPGVDYTSAVVAWSDQGALRRLSVTDPDDSGNVLTDLYFTAEGDLVFALRTTQGFKPNGALEVRNEHRLYFQQGRLVHMLAGLSRTALSPGDPLAQAEAATTLAIAQAMRKAALAPVSPTVAVGGQRKLAQGRLLDLERGDAACYAELSDEAGRVQREMADFALCDQADRLVGQTVTLAYQTTRVMAASCQGDATCTRSDVVALVTRANPIQTPARPAAAPSASGASWCQPGETDLYTCDAGAKRVSVCVSQGASAQRGQLWYRFGAAAGGVPELELPKVPTVPARTATGEVAPFAGGGGVWLRFTQGPFGYVVYSGVGRWGHNGATEVREGVQVERNGRAITTLACAAPRVNELGPEWFQRLGIAPDAQGFSFPNSGK